MTDLTIQYAKRYRNVLIPVAAELKKMIVELLIDRDRIDQIVARAKPIKSFLTKADKKVKDQPKYSDPLNQIQDQIGVRIVTFYKEDVRAIYDYIIRYFSFIESKEIIPDNESEFGYIGKHAILVMPNEISSEFSSDCPLYFELQIKTLFQHAWSEANHDIGYKPDVEISPDIKRKIAFVAAQAWGADEILNSLFDELVKNKN